MSADRHLEFVLPDLHAVTGIVSDPEGQPLANAGIQAQGAGDSPLPRPKMTAATSSTYPLDDISWSNGSTSPSPAKRRTQLKPSVSLKSTALCSTMSSYNAAFVWRSPLEMIKAIRSLSCCSHGIPFHKPNRCSAEGATTRLMPAAYRFVQSFPGPPEPYLLPPSPFYLIKGDTTLHVEMARGVRVTGTVQDKGARPHFPQIWIYLPSMSGSIPQPYWGGRHLGMRCSSPAVRGRF